MTFVLNVYNLHSRVLPGPCDDSFLILSVTLIKR